MSKRPPALEIAASLKLPQCVASAASEGSYILALASTSSTYAALATHSTESALGNRILLYSLSPNGLTHTLTFAINGENSPSSMRIVDNFLGGPALISSHRDPGCIKVWDARSSSQTVFEIYTPKKRAVMSFDVSSDGHTVAAGTDLQFDDASILYWDLRGRVEALHVHSSTHSDDITALHFHPTLPHLLLSASSDGLLSTSDIREADEDEAVLEVANWGCSIARAGWFARDADYSVWAASDMETFGLWNGDLDLLVDCGDVRQPSSPGRWTTNYLVDACEFSRATGPCDTSGLALFLGSNSGDVAFASMSDTFDPQPTWTVRGILRGVHSDVVRAVLWDKTRGIFLTGDEQGRLAAWRPAIETIEDDVEMADAADAVPFNAGARTKRPREENIDQAAKRGRYES